MNQIEYQCSISDVAHYDVVVCGGGPAGAAAIAASRYGVKTLLVESQGQLGGMATSGFVSHWLGGRSSDCDEWVVGGIFRELSERAFNGNAALLPHGEPEHFSPHGWEWEKGQLTAGIPLDPFKISVLLDDVMEEAGVDVLLLTQFVDAVVKDNLIEKIIIFNKSGLFSVKASVFVDATGDADVAARSGCRIEKGRTGDNLCAPSTVMMHVYDVDGKKFSDYIHEHKSYRFLEEIKEWTEKGEWKFDYNRFISVQLTDKSEYMINTSRICGIDGTNGQSLSSLMRQGRKENMLLLKIMRKHIPGFQNVKIKAIASYPGIRESRRIVADYVLSVEDLKSGKEFDDIIGYSSYGWDLPDPRKPSIQPLEGKGVFIAGNKTSIPFCIMLPQPVRNLICPGRSVSVERDVLGPLRVMAPCMAMGEAAGMASAIAVSGKSSLKQIDISKLIVSLKAQGVII